MKGETAKQLNSIKQTFNSTWNYMFPEVILKHHSGMYKRVSLGWSFSPIFFGPLVHLCCGIYAYGFFMMLLSVFLGAFTAGIASIIINFILAENLNRKLLEKYLLQGYEFYDTVENVQKAKEYIGS